MSKKEKNNKEKSLKNQDKKKEKQVRNALVSQIISVVDYDQNAILTEDGKYVDILQIVCKDLISASSDDIEFDEMSWDKLYKTFTSDLKIIGMNFPTDTSSQKEYIRQKMANCKNEVFLMQLQTKLAELEYISQYRTDREYYLLFYSENLDQYRDNLSVILRAMSRGTMPLVKQISRQKKESILFKIHNKNSFI